MPQLIKPRARHSSKELGRRLARRVGLVTLAVALFVVSGAGFAWYDLQSRVGRVGVGKLLGDEKERPGTEAPDSYNGRAVNLLVLGTDSRSGENNVDGSEGSDEVSVARSDTALLMHVSADRKRIDAVSIPRDTLVDIPECKRLDGDTTGAEEDGQFNSAFANGAGTGNDKKAIASGAACTWKTVEKMTDIRIDDFVVVDFNGLSKVVDSLDGVHVQVAEAIDDPDYTGMTLDEGCQKLDGQAALQYARVRHGVGDGSDISRISRQQSLMNAMVSKALASSVLTKTGFLTSTLETLTTSERIGELTTLSGLANSVKGIGTDKINFITMPNEPAADENRVVPSENAKKVWVALKEDKPVPADAAAPATTDAGATEGGQTTPEKGAAESPDAATATQEPAPQPSSSSQQPAPAAKPSAQTCPA